MTMHENSSFGRENILFLLIILALSYRVFWRPLAVFQITAISFASRKMGLAWAMALHSRGGFVPLGEATMLVGL